MKKQTLLCAVAAIFITSALAAEKEMPQTPPKTLTRTKVAEETQDESPKAPEICTDTSKELMISPRTLEQERSQTPPRQPKREEVEESNDESLRTPKRAVMRSKARIPGAPAKKKPLKEPLPQQDLQELNAMFHVILS